MVRGGVFTAGIMLAVFAIMVGIAFTYNSAARFLPLVIGIPGLLLSGTQFFVELCAADGAKLTVKQRSAGWRMVGWFVSFVLAIIAFGFVYAGPVMVALYLHFSWQERWFVSVSAGVFTWVVLFGVFIRFLNLPLFDGLVIERLF